MTTTRTLRERIAELLDEASADTLADLEAILERWRDPVVRVIDNAPAGAPLSPDEAADVAEALADTEPPITLEELRRELDL